MVAAFSQDISASLSLPCALVIYLHLWNFLEGGLRGSRGLSHRYMPDPRRVFHSDQPPWILTRSTVSYKGSLWFLLLGRIVDETLYLSPPHGPRFYSPTTPFCHFLKILILVYYFKKTLISTKKKKPRNYTKKWRISLKNKIESLSHAPTQYWEIEKENGRYSRWDPRVQDQWIILSERHGGRKVRRFRYLHRWRLRLGRLLLQRRQEWRG